MPPSPPGVLIDVAGGIAVVTDRNRLDMRFPKPMRTFVAGDVVLPGCFQRMTARMAMPTMAVAMPMKGLISFTSSPEDRAEFGAALSHRSGVGCHGD